MQAIAAMNHLPAEVGTVEGVEGTFGEGKPAEIVSFTNGINRVDKFSFEEEQELFEYIGHTNATYFSTNELLAHPFLFYSLW